MLSSIVMAIAVTVSFPTGNASLQSLATVSYCEHDPDDHYLLDVWLDYPYTYTPYCPPPGNWSFSCFNEKAAEYKAQVREFNKIYRIAVCNCWANHPTDTTARNQCIQDADTALRESVRIAKINYDLEVLDCCIRNP